MKYLSLLVFLIGCPLVRLHAQSPEGCGTNLPVTGPGRDAFELFNRQWQQRILSKTNAQPDTFVIPCVVHVVYNTPEPPLTVADVERHFYYMHEDYRNLPGSRPWGASPDFHLEFQLATKDPQGNPHPGVVFVQDALANIDADYASSDPSGDNYQLKSLSRWDSTRYCNIWVVNTIQSGAGPLAGYAQYPWDNRPSTDGVVVKFSNFGTEVYNFTATHELGHWLGLIHPFDSLNCSMGDCLNIGDKVCDTPTSASVFKYDPVRYNFCASELLAGAENPRNFMDYNSVSAHPNEFTPGQMARCLSALQDPLLDRRIGLYAPENLEAAGCGKWGRIRAYFWAPLQYIAAGQSLRFQDYSMGQPQHFRWEFEGGSPAVSLEPSPVVTWSTPGTYSVKLVVENASGRKDSLLREDFITVAAGQASLPLSQDFSGTSFPPAGWQLVSQDVSSVIQPGWQHRADVGAYGFNDGCAHVPFFDNQNRNTTDWLVLPPLTLPAQYAAISFSVAYSPLYIAEDAPAMYIGAGLQLAHMFTDTLSVEVSADNGATWHVAYQKGGQELMTTPQVNPVVNAPGDYVFTPAEEEWRDELVDLRAWNGQSVRIRFAAKNGYGNHLFLDDVSVTENSQVGRDRASVWPQLSVYPNPVRDKLCLQWNAPLASPAELQVLDVQGKTVQSLPVAAGVQRLWCEASHLPPGIYTLLLAAGNNTSARRFVKQ
ncbi:MAG: PKD domain-containing protein [Bacteroidetes bacterium]|nr:PKD domain-containing protein [Bacteroidota bacterium]